MNKNFRTGVVYVFWKKVDGLLRIDVEMIQNIARKLQRARESVARTLNQMEESRRIITNRCRDNSEYSTKTTNLSYARSLNQMVRMRN